MDLFPLPALSALRGTSTAIISGQSLSPLSSATSTFTVSAWPNTKAVEFSVAAQAIYVTFDGSVPTATNGLTIPAGSVLTWSINRIAAAKIRAATNGAIVYGVPLVY